MQETQDEMIARLRTAFQADLPLRMELDAMSRMLGTHGIRTSTCLDIGFPNPVASQRLRTLGGYWTTTVWTARERREAVEMLGEEVLQIGVNGELPFEDKQFDVVVLPRGRLTGDHDHDLALIRECHRVLKTPGYLIIGSDFRRRFTLLSLFGHDTRQGYTEKELFGLLKMGIDVLGFKTYCRFWVQLARLLFNRHSDANKGGAGRLVCYSIANFFDTLGFFTKGYHLIAHGRRKSWRTPPKHSKYGRPISDVIYRT